ncbi:MAG: alpha/beta hydrolase [Chromatiaceae bacterium]|nr:alpha/beta hydrolase [Chromatiaceae bacterium]
MAYEEIVWRCDGNDLSIGLDREGAGPAVLMLPALSSISTRQELRPLQERLAESFATISIDWPGFGGLGKPVVDWRPEVYQAYLVYLLTHVVPRPFAVIAAGHAAGYVLRHFAAHEQAAERLVLLSPTWRGPLPTMFGGKQKPFPGIAKAVDLPILGPMLYRLNVNRAVVGMMARGHVYADPAWLTDSRMQEKLAVTRAPGARHSSVRFVAGCLDPFGSRAELLDAARTITSPTLNLFSEKAPTKSRLEMEALAELSSLQTARLAHGKLSFYEEFPAETAETVREFLIGRR